MNIQATDGELGGIRDILFDDQYWTIRYLVVDTRKWLPGKKVLLSPISFDYVDQEKGTVNLLASKETVKNAPNKMEDQPISKQVEVDLADYYGWPTYWNSYSLLGPWGGYLGPMQLMDAQNQGLIQEDVRSNKKEDNHLRSANEVKGEFFGYQVNTIDEKIGHVTDFVLDETNWKITYLVVETSNLLPGSSNSYLLATDWIQDIQWQKQEVTVNLTKEQVEKGIGFDRNTPITREYEEKLYTIFDKPKYW